MNIDNFSAAIIAAAAYSRHRDISAVDAANVLHDDEGALIVRPGYRRMPSDNEQVVSIFAHWGYVLVVTHAGELKWDTEQRLIDAQAGDSLFRSFIPARTGFDVSSRTHFIANENDVFLSNANSQLKVIFHNETESVAFPFYLPPLQGVNIGYTLGGTAQGVRANFSRSRLSLPSGGRRNQVGVYVRLQPIKTIPQPETHYWYFPIEAVGRSAVSSDAEGLPQKVPVPSNTLINIVIEAGDLASDTDADYIDVFQTLSTAENEDATYYFIGRVPYKVGTHPVPGGVKADTAIETERTLIEPIAEPAWQLAEASNERLYLNTGKDNRIWMTHYDNGASYFRSVTDYVDVKTGGFRITGLKKLQQNILAVYTENRIFLLSIDPTPEQHRVIQVINSRDDKDAPIGCLAPESLVDINGYHYFLAPNQQVYRFGGERVRWMSDSINPILVKMPRTPSTKAIGFARGFIYCLAFPSTPVSRENDAMLLYDTQRKTWWKDSIRLSEVSKGRTQSEYALIDKWPAILNTGVRDNEKLIEWYWRGNKVLIPLNTLIHSLFIGALPEDVGEESLTISVTLKTEEGEQTQTLEIESAIDYWQQYVGFNLRGRSVQVTLSGAGAMKIDRLIFNPQP